MANKNSLRRVARARDAFGRIKMAEAKNRMATDVDVALAATVGVRDRKSKNPKVARSGPKKGNSR